MSIFFFSSNRPLCTCLSCALMTSDMQSVSMDLPASLRVKNRRILPDVVDYQLQLNAKNSLMRVQQNQGNGKTYISVFSTGATAPAPSAAADTQCKDHDHVPIWTVREVHRNCFAPPCRWCIVIFKV